MQGQTPNKGMNQYGGGPAPDGQYHQYQQNQMGQPGFQGQPGQQGQPGFQANGEPSFHPAYRRQFNSQWNLLFFASQCCVFSSGLIQIIDQLTYIQPQYIGSILDLLVPFDFVNYIFLCLFGFMLIIVDFPVPNEFFWGWRMGIDYYLQLFCRFAGRGITYLFLQSMCIQQLWDNNISPFLGFCLGGFVALVQIQSLVYGIALCIKMEKVRKIIAQDANPQKWQVYVPAEGMDKEKFRSMQLSVTDKQVDFTDQELTIILNQLSFNQLAPNPELRLYKDEFNEWCEMRYGILLV